MEEETRIKLPAVRVGIGTLFTIVVAGASLCVAIFWTFSDKHNYEVFVPRSEYQKDQVYMIQAVKDIKFSQDEMAKEQKTFNAEVRTDIKTILKEQTKK